MSVLSISIVFRAFVVVFSMCLLYVSLGSRAGPNIFGFTFMGSAVLLFSVVQVVCCIPLGLV